MRHIKNKQSAFGILVAFFAVFLIISSCSTEKNTFINRTYHSTTAKYNGYFNAKELIRVGLEDYRKNYREDYNDILPIELLPNEEDVVNFYPVVDTAIVKCQTVISKHSMPTSSKPSKKKTEHANWIDQNWFIIGYANYIRRDYDAALRSFEYMRKFYVDRPSTYTGELWEAKTFIKMGKLAEATRSLQKLEARTNKVVYTDAEAEKKAKKKKKKRKKLKFVKTSSSDESDSPDVPEDFKYDLAIVKAMLALEKNDSKVAIAELRNALKEAPSKEDKARLSFILGQLLEKEGNAEARSFYSESIKKNAPFEMSFNAKINRAVVSDLNDQTMIEELEDLAKEERYLEFRDQIYFAMSKVELGRNDRKKAKYYLSNSVFYSLNNPRQKGVSYEKLGDLSFEEKNYVSAQKYYDSSANVIPESYHNFEVIKNKAEKLANLVEYIDQIAFEDSVQRIANLSENDREKFLKDVVKQIQKEEKEKQERDAIRAEQIRKLQQTYAEQNQKGGSKWYFGNLKAQKEGLEEFRRVWGQRENEDYWRLSQKPDRIAFNNFGNDSIPGDSLVPEETNEIAVSELSVDDLMTDIPLTDSLMDLSNERLLASLYNSGMIYKEQLNETQMGAVQFQRVLDKDIENENNVLSAFQLYKINENGGSNGQYKSYILNNYPNTDYANYLRDPDYFIKKKERDALALKDYLRSVTRFEQGLFYPVILRADKVIEEEPDNVYRKEYFLLKAMAMGQINSDKTSLLPVLNQAILEYPETDIAKKAKELIELIENGIPPFEEFEIATQLFSYDSDEYYILVFLKENQNANSSGNNISNFNRDYFGRMRLSSAPQVYDKNTNFVMVKDFKTTSEAKDYMRDFKRIKQHIGNLRENEIIFISKENFKVMLQQQKLEEYREFYKETYK
ncbi:type IX secretion system periplasmic lipoprotein PorW/SprE [Brumimicrobium mesophilum]|uniref:type IX secretion system periplasmic lipoprotein PorW/SprE n=1 Tax=Brumimicrobium mesophilum TaxID=392717 RepID=UPI000D1433B9|nr:tetratricopeptide repeat protein [Brumimicrobium mesophilum]